MAAEQTNSTDLFTLYFFGHAVFQIMNSERVPSAVAAFQPYAIISQLNRDLLTAIQEYCM
jgi:hypothetical protein